MGEKSIVRILTDLNPLTYVLDTVLRKKTQEPQHRAIADMAIKRTTENKPAQVASNPLVAPRAELLSNAGEVFFCRILEHYFARLEKTENVVTYIHWHCAYRECRKPGKRCALSRSVLETRRFGPLGMRRGPG